MNTEKTTDAVQSINLADLLKPEKQQTVKRVSPGFYVGQKVNINGVYLMVEKVTHKRITFRIVPTVVKNQQRKGAVGTNA